MRILLSISIIFFLLISQGCSKKEDLSSPADFGMAVYDQASVDHLKRLINRRPDNVNNYLRLAHIYYDSGQRDLARQTMENAVKENPADAQARILLIKYHLEEGEIQRAEEHFYKLDDLEGDIGYSTVQAELLIKKGFYDNALQTLNKSISKDPGNAELFYLKGILSRKVSDTAAALSNLKAAVNCENVKFDIVMEYLQILADMGKTEEFFGSYDSLKPEQKSRPEMQLIFSDMLVQMNYLDSAKDILHKVEDREFLGTRHYKLAQINFDQRMYDSARYFAELAFAVEKDLRAKMVVARSYEMMYNYTESEDTYMDILQRDSTFTIAAEELEILRRKMRYLREKRRREEQKFQLTPIRPITPEN